MFSYDSDKITQIVGKVFQIEDVTFGTAKDKYLVRYRGFLPGDSAEAYDTLAGYLKPYKITPMFRTDGDRQAVVLVPRVKAPRKTKITLNIVLFVLTLLSVLLAGTIYTYEGPVTPDLLSLVKQLIGGLDRGISFAVSLLAILLAHEFGHYLAGRYHGTHVTLPYFIPFPFSPFGTMGAFIQLKEPPKNKRILLDIGIAGPLAGLVVAVPVLLLGLYLSPLDIIPTALPAGQAIQLEGNSILYLLSKFVIFGKFLPEPGNFGGLSPLLYWVKYFFTGQPFPWGGTDVILHPVAWAGWAGLLVTALNLIPAGQLDGGHAMYVLFGKKVSKILPFILAALALLGLVWPGWWLWAFLIFLMGRTHAEPLDQITELDSRRRTLAIFMVIVFFLVFTPVPLLVYGGV